MDKRATNGGHSTKSDKANDGRINSNKKILEDYLSNDFSSRKFKELMDTIIDLGIKGDTKAAGLALSYLVGKPKERKDVIREDGIFGAGFPSWFD